jgi:aspartate aminotransferase
MSLPVRRNILELEDSKIVEIWRRGLGRRKAIMLAVGEGDVPTPRFIADAAYRALLDGDTFYAHKRGIPELRHALATYHRSHWGVRLADERIAVTSAGMNAVMLAMQAALGPGDNLIAVSPVWPNIFAAARIVGGEVRMVALSRHGDQWRLDLDRLFAACDGRTRIVYAASPGNPTGWIMSAEQLVAVIELCRKRGIWLIADEVYNRLVYDRAVAPSALEIARPDDPVLVLNSFSKTWAMTGWRLGWMVMPVGLAPVIERLLEFNTSGSQPFLQRAAIVALSQGDAFVAEQVARCRAGRDLALQRLGGMRRVHALRPEGAFYIMFRVEGETDSLALALKLLAEAEVGLAPGDAFGAGGEGYLRLCFATGTSRLSEAMDRLEPFLS